MLFGNRLVGGIDQFHDSQAIRSGGSTDFPGQQAIAEMVKHCEMTILNEMFFGRVIVKQRASSFGRSPESGSNRVPAQEIQMRMPLRSKDFKSAVKAACERPTVLCLSNHSIFKPHDDD